ncbi:MAG TPA: cytochrome c oxidase subunit II [Acidimicrobiales bacterium]
MPFRSTFSRVFTLEVGIAAAVFVLVLGAVGFAFLRSRLRRRRGEEPSNKSEHTVVESAYVVLLLAVAGFLVWTSLTANAQENSASGRPSVTVRVIGFQWCWRFDYPASHFSVTGTCEGGASGENLPTLVLPTGRSVAIEVTSADVVHEFSVPYLRYRTEAMPDHTNTFRVTLTRTGRWLGRCSEFCGVLHADMDFYVKAVSPADYRRWLESHHQPVLS